MSKKKALGQDPFSKEIFPWIKSTEDAETEKGTKTLHTQTQTLERPTKTSVPSPHGKQSLPGKHIDTLRQTYHMSHDNVEKVKKYAYIERLKISEVVNKALEEFFEKKKFTG
ncbi:MAG: hypothetical protein V1653_01730 [bacterium]